MMVVDTSALIAIFENEIDADAYAAAIRQSPRLLISAMNAHEMGVILRARHGKTAVEQMWIFLEVKNDFEIVAFDRRQLLAAQSAFDRYGEGIHSGAKSNLADCAAYALTKTMSAPLLLQGNDFSATDIHSAL